MKHDLFLSKTLTTALKKEIPEAIETRVSILNNGLRRVSMAFSAENGTVIHSKMSFDFDINPEDLINEGKELLQTTEDLNNGKSSIRTIDVKWELISRWSFENPEGDPEIPSEEIGRIAEREVRLGKTTRGIITRLAELNLQNSVYAEREKWIQKCK